MVDELQPDSHCPFLGLHDDPDTWYAFPAKANLCHKIHTPQQIPLGYQGETCLTSGHIGCPIFTAEGKWRGSLPDEITGASRDARTATQRWDAEWLSRVRDNIDAEREEEEEHSEDDTLEEATPELPVEEEAVEPQDVEPPEKPRSKRPPPSEERRLPLKEPARVTVEEEAVEPQVVEPPEETRRKRPPPSEERRLPLKEPATVAVKDLQEDYEGGERSRRRSAAPTLVLIPIIVLVLVGIGVAVFAFTDLPLPFGSDPSPASTPEGQQTTDAESPAEVVPTPTFTTAPPTPTEPSVDQPPAAGEEETPDSPTSAPVEGEPFDAILSNDSNLRRGPGTAFEIIDYLTAGTHTVILGRDTPGLWVLVRLEDDREGWIVATQFIGDIGIEQLPIVPNAPLSPDS